MDFFGSIFFFFILIDCFKIRKGGKKFDFLLQCYVSSEHAAHCSDVTQLWGTQLATQFACCWHFHSQTHSTSSIYMLVLHMYGGKEWSQNERREKRKEKENGQDVHWNGRATNILISGESTSVGIVVLRCKWIERGMWLVWSEMDSVSLNETQCGIVGNFGGGGFNVDVWWNTDVVLLFFSHASWSALLSSPRIWIGLNGKWHSPSFAPVYIYAWGCIKIIT